MMESNFACFAKYSSTTQFNYYLANSHQSYHKRIDQRNCVASNVSSVKSDENVAIPMMMSRKYNLGYVWVQALFLCPFGIMKPFHEQSAFSFSLEK